jgi:hypothetical protein
MTLPDDALARKLVPLFSGCLAYFPSALVAVAALSARGNDQHNPGSPLHWDRSKSGDEADALVRHLLQRGTTDSDGIKHSTKVAWRALAALQKELEAEGAPFAPGASNTSKPIEPQFDELKLQAQLDQQDEDASTAHLKAGEAHHPFQDDDALIGNVTAPVGAQSGEIIDVTRGRYNPISQQDGS